jgi:hypothetical protein
MGSAGGSREERAQENAQHDEDNHEVESEAKDSAKRKHIEKEKRGLEFRSSLF